MVKKSVSFIPILKKENNLSTIGALILDKRAILGKKAYIDLKKKKHSLFARDLIASLDEYSNLATIESDHSFLSYCVSIRKLIEYCELIDSPIGIRIRDINSEFLLNFRTHIKISHNEYGNSHLRRMFGNIHRLMKSAQDLGLAKYDLIIPRNFKFSPQGNPTLPYTAGEALDIEDACRTHIDETLARLAQGKLLLNQGKDPRGRNTHQKNIAPSPEELKWNQLPNLLWFVMNVMGGAYIKRKGTAGRGLSSFYNSTMGVYKGPYRKSHVFSHLYPFSEDLIPFINLLAKSTGRNESSILNLQRDCLKEIDGRYILWYRKERSSERLYKKIIIDDGKYSAVNLIKILVDITNPLVKFAKQENRNYLFLGFTVSSKSENTKLLDPSYIKYQMNREGGWCDKNELQAENGNPLKISMRRWRVYYLCKKYRREGQLAKISRDAAHVISKTTVGYLNNESTKHIHEEATEKGIRAAQLVGRPTVVVTDNAIIAAKEIGTSVNTASKILKGEQDVFFSACRDFYNPPNGPKNKPCGSPWECLGCFNGVITKHVLPRTIAFKNFMTEQRLELSPSDWELKFGTAWIILHQDIFPKFSKETFSQAEREAKLGKLYIPI